MNTKKKLLSLLLAAVMVLSLLPTAFAEGLPAEDEAPVAEQSGDAIAPLANSNGPTTLYVNGVNMLDSSESAPSGVTYDADTATLTLTDATLDTFHTEKRGTYGSEYSAIVFAIGGSLTIEAKGDNTITYTEPDEDATFVSGIYFENVDLTINGGGTLTLENAATGTATNYYDFWGGSRHDDASQNSNLTIDSVTVKCEADNSSGSMSNYVHGILLWGTLTVKDSRLLMTLRNTTGSTIVGIHLSGDGLAHSLTGNTEITIIAGSNKNSIGIETSSFIQIGVGAKVRVSGEKVTPSYGTAFVSAADSSNTLSAKGSTTYNDDAVNLTDITVNNNRITRAEASKYKTIEVTATAGGSTPGDPTTTGALDFTTMDTTDNSATAGWKWDKDSKTLTLSGCNIEVEAGEDGAIILPAGATITTVEGKKNTITNTSDDPASYGVLAEGALTINGSGDLSVSGRSAGLFAEGNIAINAPITASCTEKAAVIVAKGSITIDKSSLRVEEPADGSPTSLDKGMWGFVANKVVIEKVGAPAPAAPVFNDGLGNAVADASKYVKGTTKNEKGYTFAGWFDADGKELTDVNAAVAGTTYTARWSNNGKTVRTEVLEINEQTPSTANTDEGWSWDAGTKTLTLDGATFDVHQDDGAAITAIDLPGGATITTKKGTKNVVINGSLYSAGVPEGLAFVGSAIMSDGKLTINGDGDLAITGGNCGILTLDKLTINAPISVNCTESTEGRYIYALMVHGVGDNVVAKDMISINSSLRIKTPASSEIVAETVSDDDFEGVKQNLVYIKDKSSNKAATSVVIGKASNSYYYYGGSTTTSNTPGKSPKTADAGIALYAGMAVASLLGSGVVFSRKRKNF